MSIGQTNVLEVQETLSLDKVKDLLANLAERVIPNAINVSGDTNMFKKGISLISSSSLIVYSGDPECIPASEICIRDGVTYCRAQSHPDVLHSIYSIALQTFSKDELTAIYDYFKINWESYISIYQRTLKMFNVTTVSKDKNGVREYTDDGQVKMVKIDYSNKILQNTLHLSSFIRCIEESISGYQTKISQPLVNLELILEKGEELKTLLDDLDKQTNLRYGDFLFNPLGTILNNVRFFVGLVSNLELK